MIPSKKSFALKRLLLLLALLINAIDIIAQKPVKTFKAELLKLHGESSLPGFAVAIVQGDTITFQESFGYGDMASKTPFSIEQRFYIASISKTFIGLSLMKLIEEGQLELTTDINTVLPFQVVNPYYPNEVITVEQLARHTSSILYGDLESKSWYLDAPFTLSKKEIGKTAFKSFRCWSQNQTSELGSFLQRCLSPNGDLYSKRNFSKEVPGSTYSYSNLGAALAAYVIELKTGIPYDTYVEKLTIDWFAFQPNIWRHKPEALLPLTYFEDQIAVPKHTPILYPTGGMLLSCAELTTYLTEMIRGFNGNGSFLRPTSFQTMMSPSDQGAGEQGIFWNISDTFISHNGGNYGTICLMGFDKNTGAGKLFMTNISSYRSGSVLGEVTKIWKKIDDMISDF